MPLVNYIPETFRIPFMRGRHWSFPLSAALTLLSVFGFLVFRLDVGIDFKGGTLVELQSRAERADVAAVREQANALGLGEVEVQEFGNDGREVSVRVELQPGGDQGQQPVVEKLRSTLGADYEFRRVEVVGPRVSGELVQSGTLGVVLSLVAILVYLWFRFEWQFAIGAVIATLHDIVLTIGFFALTQLDFNMTSIAAILTIIGYSLNDTVVVYDRIRETMRKYKRLPIEELLDRAMNETLARTLVTGVSTGLALVALAVFGGEVLKSFSYAMLFGLVVGTYSSVFIASPILIYLGLKLGSEAPAAADVKVAQPQAAE